MSVSAASRSAPEPTLLCTRESISVASTTATALFITGEIDIATDGGLDDALAELLIHQSANVVVDLTEVRFCSVGGFAMLMGAAQAVAAHGGQFAIVSRSTQIARLCAQLWPSRSVPCHRTVTAAFTEIRLNALESVRSSVSAAGPSTRHEVRP